jgi:hypothetical protein
MRTLSVESSFDAPLSEVSGLAIQRTPGRAPRLLAIADGSYDVAVAPLTEGPHLTLTLRATSHLFDAKGGGRSSQWEAVTCDRLGRVLVLQETPGTLYVLDPDLGTLLATVRLEAGKLPAGKGWREDQESRGEGLVLLANGHLLVLKEKEPTQLVEFGPTGDAPGELTPGGDARFVDGSTLTILACWDVPEGDDSGGDLSELAVGPDGAFYVLGDNKGVLCRLAPLPMGGGALAIAESWQLPDEVTSPEGKGEKRGKKKDKKGNKGKKGKPEGLVIGEDLRPLVAIDRQESGGKSLFLLEPLR